MQSVLFLVAVYAFGDGAFGFAQHPGAYSSPQYAKKGIHYSQPYNQPSPYNEPEYQKVATVDRESSNERSKHHEIDLKEYGNNRQDSYERHTNQETSLDGYQNVDNNDIDEYSGNGTQSGRSTGFMASAGNFLNGRGGQMLADIAKELIARSTGATSQVGPECIAQVLSLNLTNLVILVVLKALILAAGMFGAGAWQHGYARSLNDDNSMWIGKDELSLWLGYLEGGDRACLTRAACDSPSLASRYSSGADLLLTGAKMLQGTIPYDSEYEKILEEVKEAAKWGSKGFSCDVKYKKCSKEEDD